MADIPKLSDSEINEVIKIHPDPSVLSDFKTKGRDHRALMKKFRDYLEQELDKQFTVFNPNTNYPPNYRGMIVTFDNSTKTYTQYRRTSRSLTGAAPFIHPVDDTSREFYNLVGSAGESFLNTIPFYDPNTLYQFGTEPVLIKHVVLLEGENKLRIFTLKDNPTNNPHPEDYTLNPSETRPAPGYEVNNPWLDVGYDAGGTGVTVVQSTGQSTTDVMSQKAVTDALAGLAVGGFPGYTVEVISSDLPYTTLKKTATNLITHLYWNGVVQYDGVDFSKSLNTDGSVTLTGLPPLIAGSGFVKYVALGNLDDVEEPVEAPVLLQAFRVGTNQVALQYDRNVNLTHAEKDKGLSLEYDNQFIITPVYASGDGTDTLIFNVTAFAPENYITATYTAVESNIKSTAGGIAEPFFEILVDTFYYFRAEFNAQQGTLLTAYTPEVGTITPHTGTADITDEGWLQPMGTGYQEVAFRMLFDPGVTIGETEVLFNNIGNDQGGQANDTVHLMVDYVNDNNWKSLMFETNGFRAIGAKTFTYTNGTPASTVLWDGEVSDIHNNIALLLRPNGTGGLEGAIKLGDGFISNWGTVASSLSESQMGIFIYRANAISVNYIRITQYA